MWIKRFRIRWFRWRVYTDLALLLKSGTCGGKLGWACWFPSRVYTELAGLLKSGTCGGKLGWICWFPSRVYTELAGLLKSGICGGKLGWICWFPSRVYIELAGLLKSRANPKSCHLCAYSPPLQISRNRANSVYSLHRNIPESANSSQFLHQAPDFEKSCQLCVYSPPESTKI